MNLAFGTPLSQSGRLLQLTTPMGADQLQALRAHGVERIGRTPRYTLDVLVQDTEYDPEKLIGQPVSLALLCDDGSQAPRQGLVESVRYLGSDGGLHDWQLVFAPWFSLLEYRSDCRIWQDKTLPAILESVFSQYEQAKGNYRLDLRREYAPLSYVTQFNETDANFVQRWCAAESKSPKLYTWGTIEWGSKNLKGLDAKNAKLSGDNLDAQVELNGLYTLEIGPGYYPSDGTVPAFSSSSPRGKPGVKGAFAHGQNSGALNQYCKTGIFNQSTGYGHQDAYTDKAGRTRFATLYSLVRLSAQIGERCPRSSKCAVCIKLL